MFHGYVRVHPPKVLLGSDPVRYAYAQACSTVGAAQSVILNALRPYP